MARGRKRGGNFQPGDGSKKSNYGKGYPSPNNGYDQYPPQEQYPSQQPYQGGYHWDQRLPPPMPPQQFLDYNNQWDQQYPTPDYPRGPDGGPLCGPLPDPSGDMQNPPFYDRNGHPEPHDANSHLGSAIIMGMGPPGPAATATMASMMSPIQGGTPMMNGMSMGCPPQAQGGVFSDETVPKSVHDELLKQHKTLRGNYDELEKRYEKLKNLYKRLKESTDGEIQRLQEKYKLAVGGKVESAVLPDDEKHGDNDKPDNHIEVENPKYRNKDHINVKDASAAVIRSERDVYKKNANDLTKKLDEVRKERSAALSKNGDLIREFVDIKDKLEKIQYEKVELEEKLSAMEEDVQPESAMASPYNSDNDADTEKKLKSIFKRKEFYKSKYLRLLEEQNREQRSFLLLNKRLLEQYVFKS